MEKPIHKFNNGRGATLCNVCSVIISEGMTEATRCENCKGMSKEVYTGKMTKVNETWLVYRKEELMGPRVIRNHEYPLHADSAKEIALMNVSFDNIDARIAANPTVKFRTITEGTTTYAFLLL